MGQFKVKVSNGDVGLNDRVAWFSKRYGVRYGTIRRLTESQYGGVRISVKPESVPGRSGYTYPQSLGNMRSLISVPPAVVPLPTLPAGF